MTFSIDFPSKPKEIKQIINNTRKLSLLIKKYKINIAHANGNPDHKLLIYCKIFYKLNFNIIRTKHDDKKIKNNLLSIVQYKYFMNKMIVVSQFQSDTMKDITIRNKTIVIRNGVDLDYFKPIKKDLNLLAQYKIKDDDFVFVSVAGTALHKGWQHLIEATSKLNNSKKSKVKIIIAGSQPSNKYLQQYVLDKGMESNVIFTGSLNDVRGIISLGDISFVLSSSIETISFACREMMAMGKPAIVSNHGGLPENIENHIDGWVVPLENNNLYNLIEKILEINNLDEMSKNAIKKSKEEFSLETFVQKTYQVWDEQYNNDY